MHNCIGERMSRVTRGLKQLALDVAELHDNYHQVPAESRVDQSVSAKRSTTVRRSLFFEDHLS